MLLLWDRNFLGFKDVRAVLGRKAHLLARIKGNLVFEPFEVLPDGSYLSKIYPSSRHRKRDEGGIVVRLIEYTLDEPGRPQQGKPHRLLTTLLDGELDPALALVELY